ncbi:MAG: peptidoglycan-binding protein, partial [Clostridiales bacterium]|nr:peptidoglycan-binding protein [Clostridiales bacterium]
ATRNAVIEFQKAYKLTADGVVGPTTWNKLYSVFRGIGEQVTVPPNPPPTGMLPFPGELIREGSAGANVRHIQNRLNVIRTGYPSIPSLVVDGLFGPATRRAVIAFQQQFLLSPDGIVGPITWAKIEEIFQLVTGGVPPSQSFPGTPLTLGSSGSAVRLMQGYLQELRAVYPAIPALTVDGIFGPATQAAVMAFQRLFNLTPDGIIGPITWEAIVRQWNAVV